MKEIYFLRSRHRAKKDDARQAGRICYKHEKCNFKSWHLLNKSLWKNLWLYSRACECKTFESYELEENVRRKGSMEVREGKKEKEKGGNQKLDGEREQDMQRSKQKDYPTKRVRWTTVCFLARTKKKEDTKEMKEGSWITDSTDIQRKEEKGDLTSPCLGSGSFEWHEMRRKEQKKETKERKERKERRGIWEERSFRETKELFSRFTWTILWFILHFFILPFSFSFFTLVLWVSTYSLILSGRFGWWDQNSRSW